MQKKHLIGAGITAFSVILGLLWLMSRFAQNVTELRAKRN